jgi:hypothetical protein
MSLLLHLAMAGVAGIVVFCLLPVATFILYGFEAARRVGSVYVQLAMATLGRGLLVLRGVGVRLLATDYDGDTGTEKGSLGGRRLDWEDPDNRMTRWAGVPFGIALEDREVITDVRQLLLAEEFAELRRRENATRQYEVRNEDREVVGQETARQAYFDFEPGRRVVSLAPIAKIVQRSARPSLVSRILKLTELSQKQYDTRAKMQYFIWLMALGAGFGLMFLGAKLQSTVGSGGGTTISAPTGFVMIPWEVVL